MLLKKPCIICDLTGPSIYRNAVLASVGLGRGFPWCLDSQKVFGIPRTWSIPRNSSRLEFQPESIQAVFLPEHGFHARPWNSRPNVFLLIIDIFCE